MTLCLSAFTSLLDELEQFRVRFDGFELRKFFLHIFRRVNQKSDDSLNDTQWYL